MQISIIGSGWLGLPLGERLVKAGHHVMGSTTRQEKFPVIEASGVKPVLMKLEPMPIGNSFNQLFQTDLLIVNIPPGRKKNLPSHYQEQIKYLKYLIDQHQVPRVVFVSSTSYYPNTNSEVNEETSFDLDNGSSEAVVLGEKEIRQINAELIILRCGGLMGGDRIPGKWFAGKETKGADTPVNYVHREDVIGMIFHLLDTHNPTTNVINLVAPQHPVRKDIHDAMAAKYGFEKPIWVGPGVIPHKIVSSKAEGIIDYKFEYPDPLHF